MVGRFDNLKQGDLPDIGTVFMALNKARRADRQESERPYVRGSRVTPAEQRDAGRWRYASDNGLIGRPMRLARRVCQSRPDAIVEINKCAHGGLLRRELCQVLVGLLQQRVLTSRATNPDGLAVYVDLDRNTHRAEQFATHGARVLFLGGSRVLGR